MQHAECIPPPIPLSSTKCKLTYDESFLVYSRVFLMMSPFLLLRFMIIKLCAGSFCPFQTCWFCLCSTRQPLSASCDQTLLPPSRPPAERSSVASLSHQHQPFSVTVAWGGGVGCVCVVKEQPFLKHKMPASFPPHTGNCAEREKKEFPLQDFTICLSWSLPEQSIGRGYGEGGGILQWRNACVRPHVTFCSPFSQVTSMWLRVSTSEEKRNLDLCIQTLKTPKTRNVCIYVNSYLDSQKNVHGTLQRSINIVPCKVLNPFKNMNTTEGEHPWSRILSVET